MKRRRGARRQAVAIRFHDASNVIDERRSRGDQAVTTPQQRQIFLRLDATMLNG
jgi:hypothetical protein